MTIEKSFVKVTLMDDFKRTLEMQAIIAMTERMQDGSCDAPITNTSKMHSAEHLLDAMNNGTEGFIEGMEAKGQQEMVKAAGSRLPAEGTGPDYQGKCFDWSSWGIKIGEPIKGDEIWVEAELPDGWKVEATGHSMWSNLLDEKGRERAGIFYKAAFYDRSCHINPSRRYSTDSESVIEQDYDGPYVFLVKDGGAEIYRSEVFEGEPEPEGWKYGDTPYRGSDLARKAAEVYMAEHYPDHSKPEAYWD